MSRKTVLLTNDDGFWAPGIRLVHDALAESYNVVVVAPDAHLSGAGHGITLIRPLKHGPLPENLKMNGYWVGGTPADCVKCALTTLLDAPPDAVVSGMNFGENSGISTFYSGTLAGAREGAMVGLPSIALSLSLAAKDHAQEYARHGVEMVKTILARPELAAGRNEQRAIYNVNFPPCPPAECKGVRVTRQSTAAFADAFEFREHRDLGPGYWLAGGRGPLEDSPEFDSPALQLGYTTITPLSLDTTEHSMLEPLQNLEDFDLGSGKKDS